MAIILRSVKGSALTHPELDGNFTTLDTNTNAHLVSSTAHTAANLVNVPAGNIAATTVQAALNELDTEKLAATHTSAAGAHTAANISNVAAGNIAATTVQAALNELDAEKLDVAHASAAGAHTAANISNVAAGNIAATNVQAALNELDTEKLAATHTSAAGAHTAANISNVAAGNIIATTVQAAINELDTEKLDVAHTSAAGAHTAANITNVAAGNISATTVQAAINELDTEKLDAAHAASSTAHTAANIVNVAAGNISAVTVQAAINELDTEKLAATHTSAAGAHTAANITNVPAGNVVATTVQAAITELDADLTTTNGRMTTAEGNITTLTSSKANVSHTHVAANITDFSEAVDDRVAALLVTGTNTTVNYNDGANTLAIDVAVQSLPTSGVPGFKSATVEYPSATFAASSQAAMIGVSSAFVGMSCLRTDVGSAPGTLYVLQRTPASTATNWEVFSDTGDGRYLGVFSWATRPTLATYSLAPGDTFRASDIGPSPGTWFTWSSSNYWRPLNGTALLAEGVDISSAATGQASTWTRVTTVATVTFTNHGYVVGQNIKVVVTSDAAAIALGTVRVTTVADANTFTFACTNAGAASGTLTTDGNEPAGSKVALTIPAGLLFPGASIQYDWVLEKNDTTEVGNSFVRFGTIGAKGDQLLTEDGTVAATWTRSGTTATFTLAAHGFESGDTVSVFASNDLTAVTLGNKTVTWISSTTFSVPCLNAGITTGGTATVSKTNSTMFTPGAANRTQANTWEFRKMSGNSMRLIGVGDTSSTADKQYTTASSVAALDVPLVQDPDTVSQVFSVNFWHPLVALVLRNYRITLKG